MNKFLTLIFSFILCFTFSFPCFAVGVDYTVDNSYTSFDYTFYSDTPEKSFFYFLYDAFVSDPPSELKGVLKRLSYPSFSADQTFFVVYSRSSGSLGNSISVVKSSEPLFISEPGTLELLVDSGSVKSAIFSYSVTDNIFSISNAASSSKLNYVQIWGANYDLSDSSGVIVVPGASGEKPWESTVPDSSEGGINEDSLVGKLISAIVGLFIPEEGYFEEWMDGMVSNFENRSGLLTYPLSILIQFVDTVSSLKNVEPVLILKEIEFMGFILIPPMTFNFNSLLENETFSFFHSIYFIFVKAGLAFGLVRLAVKKSNEYGL